MEDLKATEMLSKTTPIKCESCGCDSFLEATMLRRVSRLLLGEQKDGILPVPVFCCSKCGYINKEFRPTLPEDEKESPIIQQ